VNARKWWTRHWPAWAGGPRGAHRSGAPEVDNGHTARARLNVERAALEREQIRTEVARRTAGRLPAAADRFGQLVERSLGAK